MKLKCRWCDKPSSKKLGEVRLYVIADNLEEPKAYHKDCIQLMYIKAMQEYDKQK